MARIVRFHQYGDPSVLKIEDLDASGSHRRVFSLHYLLTGFFHGDSRTRREMNP
jgi:hypothetical protein